MAIEFDKTNVSGSLRNQSETLRSADANKFAYESNGQFQVGHVKREANTNIRYEKEQLARVAAQIENFLRENVKPDLSVQMNESLNRPVIRIVDAKSNIEFSIPSETAIRIAESVEQMRGYFFDGKA